MNIADQIAQYEARGFTKGQAELFVIVRQAAVTLFSDFPENFVLVGGATLILFFESVRHSADLDLLSRAEKLPSADEMIASLKRGVDPAAEALSLAPLQIETDAVSKTEVRLSIATASGQRLFRIDLNRYGSVTENEIVNHKEEVTTGIQAEIKAASKDLLLLQKSEAFLLRRFVKARDAYDIHLLKSLGAELKKNLREHLSDTLIGNQIGPEQIHERIEAINARQCRTDLRPYLPAAAYSSLEVGGFQHLRDVLRALYAEWL
jgi:hypothetical protein